MTVDKDTSRGLMVANLIATILVIAIHYNSKGHIQPEDTAGWNYLFQEFTLNGVARIAVPFFAMLSAFFLAAQIENQTRYSAILKSKAKTLLLPYITASTVIFLVATAIQWVTKHNSYQSITIASLIQSSTLHPISDQFWFLRDLIILIILSPFLLGTKQKKYLTTVLFFFWVVDYQIFPIFFGWYLLSIETLFFFSLGGLVFQRRKLLHSTINTRMRNKISVLALWIFLIIIRVCIDPNLNNWYASDYTLLSIILYKIAILLGIVSLMQFSIYLSSNKLLIYISGLTFFAYLFHLVPLSYMQVVTSQVIEKKYAFYINYPIALISVFVTAHLLSKFTPKCFSFIAGGRNPNKALKRAL